MITQYFAKQPDGMDVHNALVVATAAPPVPASFDTAVPSHQAAVEQVVASLMAHMGNKRRKVQLEEAAVRQFVLDVAEERTPVHVPHTPNPAQAVGMSQLLHRAFHGQLSTWQHFYTSTRPLFAPLLRLVQGRRGESHVNQFFSLDESGEGGSSAGKRKRGEDVPQVAATACVVKAGWVVEPLDAWDRAHVLMRDRVLDVQQRICSPPSSPVCKPAVVKLTESEQLQLRVRQCSVAPRQRTAMDELTQLFDIMNTDTSITPLNYDPPYDRNDLFLTNLADARRLLALGQEYMATCLATKAAGRRVADVPCPAVHIVAIHFLGAVGSVQLTCRYITWCLHSECSTLLEEALCGRVVFNLMFTELMDKVSRSTCQEMALWKQQFKLEVLDSSGGAVSAQSLPALVALTDTYAEQFGGVGKSNSVIGLNFVQHHHGRHRLIFEAGSVAMYRVIWHCSRVQHAYQAAHDKASKAAVLTLDSAATFWQRLSALLPDPKVSSRAAAAELNALARYFVDCVHACDAALVEAEKGCRLYERCAAEKREHVERAYAAAQVQAFRDGYAVDARIADMYECVQQNYLGDIPGLDALRARVAKVHGVQAGVVGAWYCICSPPPSPLHLKQLVENQDAKRGKKCVKVLRALMLLNIWQPRPWCCTPAEVNTAELPLPPQQLDAAEVATGFKQHIRQVHTDKNVRDIHEGRTTAHSQHELTCKVIKARTIIQAHLSTVAVEETLSSVSSS